MAREAPVYEDVEEFDAMLAKLIELNSDRFGDVDPAIIKMVKIINKEPSYWYKIKTIKQPVTRWCKDVRFVVVVFSQDWDSYGDVQKAKTILNVLSSLEPDEDEPKIKPFDVHDHSDMLRTFGVNYMNDPLPEDILTKAVDWK